jgi:hypothetical protein
MQNCTDGMSDDAVKTMSRTNKKYLWQMKNRLFTHSSTEYCGESNEIVLFVFVTNVVIVNKQPGLHLCYVYKIIVRGGNFFNGNRDFRKSFIGRMNSILLFSILASISTLMTVKYS